MRVVYRARDEPRATREEYWRDVIDRAIAPLDVCYPGGVDENEQIVTGHIGPMRLAAWNSGPAEVSHTRGHSRRSNPDVFHVFAHGRGRVVGEQAGRQAELVPGDVTLVDTSLPFRCVHDASEVVCVAIPWTLLPAAQQHPKEIAGIRIAGDVGSGALLSSLVRQLPRHLDHLDGSESYRVGIAVIDLLSVTLAGARHRPEAAASESRQRALTLRIQAFIEARLADPGLDPASIAAAHHISVRYLHKLFAADRKTVAGFVRARRLERCRRDLLDAGHSALPVSVIAARNGFAEPSHFNRAFRAAYGMPPGEYRQLATAGAS